MAEPLRKLGLEDEETIELEGIPGPAPPGAPANGPQAGQIGQPGRPWAVRTLESLGRTVGILSRSVRTGLDTVSHRSREAGERLAAAADQTRTRAQELSLEAGRRAQDTREASIYRMRRLRRDAGEFANRRPLETILAIAATAFSVGLAWKIWRSNRG